MPTNATGKLITVIAAVHAEPPLRLVLDLPLLAVAALAYVALAALLVALATATRGEAPARVAEAAA